MNTQKIVDEFLEASHLTASELPGYIDKLVEFLTVQGIKIGGRYRHFKGVEYIVDGVGADGVVEYHNADDPAKEWERHVSIFTDYIDRPEYKGARFTLIG